MQSTLLSRKLLVAAQSIIVASTLGLAVTACGGNSPSNNDSVEGGPGGPGSDTPVTVAARSFDQTVVSTATRRGDTTAVNVTMTVFVPEHLEGETYPLILHSHGFGGSRVGIAEAANSSTEPSDPDNTSSIFGRIDDQVRLLWDDGYAVVSFDERGFGRGDDGDDGNDGLIEAMDPDFEIQDAIAVLDWAEDNLDITEDANGNPVVGAIGGSYGGGYQLLLAAFDDRLDAITPTATWYSLLRALVPGTVIKKGYGTGLCTVITADNAEAGPRTTSACQQASTQMSTRYQEDILVDNAEVTELFEGHGMNRIQQRHEDSSDSFTMRPVDTLLIQGNRDILFDLNQSIDNYNFLSGIGGDVRMMTIESGHSLRQTRMLGGSQGVLGPSTCGPLDSPASIRAWFDLKLRGNAAASSLIPAEICLSLNDTQSINLNALPDATAAAFDDYELTVPGTAITAAQNNTQSEGGGTFIPLSTAIGTAVNVIAGQPIAELTVSDSNAAGAANGGTTVFVGIGIRRSGTVFLVEQQVLPIRSVDTRSGATPEPIELIGVSELLQENDEVGLLLYGSFDQFEAGTGTPTNYNANNNVTVSGTVRLPIFNATVNTRQ